MDGAGRATTQVIVEEIGWSLRALVCAVIWLFSALMWSGLAAGADDVSRLKILDISNSYLSAGYSRITVSGAAAPGRKVSLFSRETELGSAITDSDGGWSISPNETLSGGAHVLRAITGRGVMPSDTSDSLIVYIVERGDTLWAIARQFYQVGYLWPIISGSHLNMIPDPHLIYPAQVLVLPDENFDVSGDRFARRRAQTAGGMPPEEDGQADDKPDKPLPGSRQRPTFGAVGVNADGTLYISGKAAPNATVKLYYRGKEIGTTTADDDGVWEFASLTISGLPEGTHISIRAMAIDKNNRRMWSEGDKQVYVPAGVTPESDKSGGGEIIPPISSNLDHMIPEVDVANWSDKKGVRVGGRAGANAVVEIFDKGRLIGSTTSDARGKWVFHPDPPLPPGDKVLAARTEAAGGDKIWSDEVHLVVPEPSKPPPSAIDAPPLLADDEIFQSALDKRIKGQFHHSEISPMFVGDLKVLNAVISYPDAVQSHRSIAALKGRKTFDIKIGNTMRVQLIGNSSAFEISPENAIDNVLTKNSPAEYRWHVRAKMAGDYTLTFLISAFVTVNGEQKEKVVPQEIPVSVVVKPKTIGEKIMDGLKWIGALAGILVAVFGVIAGVYKGYKWFIGDSTDNVADKPAETSAATQAGVTEGSAAPVCEGNPAAQSKDGEKPPTP